MQFTDFTKLCHDRSSIRTFADKPVERQVVEDILQCAHLAPSVGNTQPWVFHVVQHRDLLKKLEAGFSYGAIESGTPTLIVVACNNMVQPTKVTKMVLNPNELEYSCVCAMNTAMLAAVAHGLIGTWVSLERADTHVLLDLPNSELIIGGLLVGYPKQDPAPYHERSPFKEHIIVH